jgi:UDPglucose 6-dehydrogenase
MNKIGVIGLGYVGTAVQKGFESIRTVVTYDIAKECTAKSIEELVVQSRIIFICVPTPMNPDGTCNVDIVKSVLRNISEVETWHKPICVLKSTVTPGTTEQLSREFTNLTICFNPEFLTERNYIKDFMSQVNIIVGHSEISDTQKNEIQPVIDLYTERFSQAIVWITPAKEAEMVKYVANTMLAAKVAYLNEIYQICEKTNINYNAITKILRRDERLGTTHWNVPGHDGKYGFGGTCFPKDLNALIQFGEVNGQSTPLLKAVWEKNLEVRPERDWEYDKGRAVV